MTAMPEWLDDLVARVNAAALPWFGHADDFDAWEVENGWRQPSPFDFQSMRHGTPDAS